MSDTDGNQAAVAPVLAASAMTMTYRTGVVEVAVPAAGARIRAAVAVRVGE